jgi:uncharacterized protein (TIGR02757 family)
VSEANGRSTNPALHGYLDGLVRRYERPAFIDEDPISIPHGFSDREDRAVIGLFAALLAWGRRDVMLRKLRELCERMRMQPARFVRRYDDRRDAERLDGFKHRTFQPIDARWLVKNLRSALEKYGSMQRLFTRHLVPSAEHVGPAIQGFSETILQIDPETPARLRKHLARPEAGSACKRLAMYLRWMVRGGPVDFGTWRQIRPAQLLVPLDTHSGRTARRLGLLRGRKSNDWKAALQLTRRGRRLAPRDPARYDFALFGAGVSDASLAERLASSPDDEADATVR